MSDPFIKVIRGSDVPQELLANDKIIIVTDRAGFEMFHRLIDRAQARENDSPVSFRAWKDRVVGAFMAGASVMGWVV